jgi:hypothetical protein
MPEFKASMLRHLISAFLLSRILTWALIFSYLSAQNPILIVLVPIRGPLPPLPRLLDGLLIPQAHTCFHRYGLWSEWPIIVSLDIAI